MTTWWAETISVVTRRLLLAEFFRILANSQEFIPANEIEQNRFLTLRAGLILGSNGVYREKFHFLFIRNEPHFFVVTYTNYEMGCASTCHGFTKPEKCGSQEPT